MISRLLLASLAYALYAGALAQSVAAETFQFTTRALWVDPTALSSPEAVDQLLAKCQRAKINTVLPCVMSHGTIYFKSAHFRGHTAAAGSFDPLAYAVRKAHEAGIQLQAWCCVYYEGADKPTNPDWVNRSLDGKLADHDFLSAANPEVNKYLLPVITDLLAYDIDGIHLDYIRYPNTVYDYSEPGRRAFQAVAGFDPINFLDHPERIVPVEKEPYPIRVLHTRSQAARVWETGAIERTLDGAGIGFAFVSESPVNIDSLRAPGMLICSGCYDVPPDMLAALQRYVRRGGNLLWADAPSHTLRKSQALQELTGLSGGKWIAARRMSLRPVGDHPLSQLIPTNAFVACANNAPELKGAQVLAKLDSGEPAVTLNQFGQGHVLVLGFDVMESKSIYAALLMKEVVNWSRTRAGVRDPDLLATKRAEWVKWRGEQVTDLVRGVSRAAKSKDPKLVVTSSGGPSPWEFYVCYRDARRWLAEGINDCVFPMNYTPDPVELDVILRDQVDAAPTGKLERIFPGLQLYTTRTINGKPVSGSLDAATVDKELRLVGQQGYRGFCLFADCYLTDEIIKVVRRYSPN